MSYFLTREFEKDHQSENRRKTGERTKTLRNSSFKKEAATAKKVKNQLSRWM
jgi:hypothetical protein